MKQGGLINEHMNKAVETTIKTTRYQEIKENTCTTTNNKSFKIYSKAKYTRRQKRLPD